MTLCEVFFITYLQLFSKRKPLPRDRYTTRNKVNYSQHPINIIIVYSFK